MLSNAQFKLCRRVMSSRAFYAIVKNALESKEALSVVRIGDGEKFLFDLVKDDMYSRDIVVRPGHEKWLDNLGVTGITQRELYRRLWFASTECDYFAPSVSGLYLDGFNLYDTFPSRDIYVDNFFVNDWVEEMKAVIFRQAGHVLLIHNNANTADSMQLRAQANLQCKVTYLPLSHWSQAESVIAQAGEINAPLVLFSGGPAAKYIGPIISRGGHIPKVVLDLGNAADHWTFSTLPANREVAEAFHAEWAKKNL